jgi:S1-C subfamily serine protease
VRVPTPQRIESTELVLPMTDRLDPPPPDDPSPAAGRSRRMAARLRRATPFLAGVLAAFLGIALYATLFPAKPGLTERQVVDTVGNVLASQTPGPPRSELVFNAIQPSLVLIEIDTQADASPDPAASHPTEGLGTGVVVNADGQILTALHVVDDATHIRVTFADGSKSTATISGQDEANDIAVLAPDTPPAQVVPATLGNPGAMHIGSEAYIVGNPFGLYGSLSTGVVSGLERSFRLPETDRVITGLIQVDAAVNPGNSGGPLLDRNGNVTGIVTALINPTDDDVFIGIGLAVPIDVAGGAAGAPQY